MKGIRALIVQHLPLWYSGDYYNFIMQLGITFELDWENFVQEIGDRIELLLRYGEETPANVDAYVVFSMIISKLIYCFREKAALNLLRELKSEYSFIYHQEIPMTKIQRILSQEASLLLNLRIFEDFHSLLRRNKNKSYQKLKKSVIKLLNDDTAIDLKQEIEEIRSIHHDEGDTIVQLSDEVEFKIPKPP